MAHLLLLLSSLLLTACAATAPQAPAPEATNASEGSCPDAVSASEAAARQWDPRELQAVHDAVAQHGAQVQACALEAAAEHPVPMDPPATASFFPAQDDGVYRASHRRQDETTTPKRPFEVAFEQCLEPHVAAWGLPPTVPDRRFGVSFDVVPAGDTTPSASDACFASPVSAGLRSTIAQTEQARIRLAVSQMTPPVRVSGRIPQYTQEAIEHAASGMVQVRCTVTRGGRLQDCEVRRSVQYMDEAVLSALRTWCMQPVLCNGQRIEAPYTFNLDFKPPRWR